jgi:hypothetical protein
VRMADLEPEAVYLFTDDNGERSGSVVFYMQDPSQIPGLAKPWFLAFSAVVTSAP